MGKRIQFAIKLLTILALSVCFSLPVQKDNTENQSQQLSQKQLAKHDGHWYYFKKGSKIPIKELIDVNYSIFDLPKGIKAKIEKTDIDDLGMTHYLIKLEINGIPIEDGYYTVHYSKEGDLM